MQFSPTVRYSISFKEKKKVSDYVPRLLRLWDVFEIWHWLDLMLHSHSGIKLGGLSFVMTDLRGSGKVKEGLNNLLWSLLFSKHSSESRFPWHLICLEISERGSLIIPPQIWAFRSLNIWNTVNITSHDPSANHDHLILLTLMNWWSEKWLNHGIIRTNEQGH